METPTLTAERLRALAELYEQGQVSDLMERTLAKLLRHEADACQGQLRQLQADLREFEQKYQRSSAEFYPAVSGRTNQRCHGLCGMGVSDPNGGQSHEAPASPGR